MPFSLDPEVESGVNALFEELDLGDVAPMAVGDVASRRAIFDPMQRRMFQNIPAADDVSIDVFDVPTEDGSSISVRWYRKAGSAPGSAVLYAHGSGMIASSVEIYDPVVSAYVTATGVPFLSVGYRKAPEFPAPVPVTDLYAAFEWLVARAGELGVDLDRIAVMGDSGGGGVAASMAIYARDRGGPAIAKQVLDLPDAR